MLALFRRSDNSHFLNEFLSRIKLSQFKSSLMSSSGNSEKVYSPTNPGDSILVLKISQLIYLKSANEYLHRLLKE